MSNNKKQQDTFIDPELGELEVIFRDDTEEEKKRKEKEARERLQEYDRLSGNVPKKDI